CYRCSLLLYHALAVCPVVCTGSFFVADPCGLLALLVFLLNDAPTTQIYTLSLHDALPISMSTEPSSRRCTWPRPMSSTPGPMTADRKSTRLNSITFRSRMPSSA